MMYLIVKMIKLGSSQNYIDIKIKEQQRKNYHHGMEVKLVNTNFRITITSF